MIKALQHPFFSSYPPPTAPVNLPKPKAELAPRAVILGDIQETPVRTGSSDAGGKRKVDSPATSTAPGVRRRLFG
jgi:cyclin-dependent kinase 7